MIKRTFTRTFLDTMARICEDVSGTEIERVAFVLKRCRDRGGRVFMLGVGGSAANASHAVNDFRKLAGIETYAPTDNVAELTAITNDIGWEWTFQRWLEESHLRDIDLVFILSVGGGQPAISLNLVRAIDYAGLVGATIAGIVGRDGGYTARHADACVIVPTLDAALVTPFTESMQSLVLHLLVSHPSLLRTRPTW